MVAPSRGPRATGGELPSVVTHDQLADWWRSNSLAAFDEVSRPDRYHHTAARVASGMLSPASVGPHPFMGEEPFCVHAQIAETRCAEYVDYLGQHGGFAL